MKKSMIVIAALALVLSMSTGAYAAKGLLTGNDIKNGSLTGADMKRQSLGAALFSDSAKSSLSGPEGQTGARGEVGPAGLTGLTGSTGPVGANGAPGTNGTITPLSTTHGLTALPTASPPTTVVELAVPAGSYVILAKTQLSHTGAGDSVDCWLKAGATTLDQIAMKTLPALAAVPASLQAVITVSSTTQLSVECDVFTANGAANFSSLIAMPTS